MNFKELLSKIQDISEQNDISTPYIVGGVPREVTLKHNLEFNDFDITTGNNDIDKLAELFAESQDAEIKKFRDGHIQVITSGLKFDFSSNFSYKDIDAALKEKSVEDVDDLVRETYSRDFTINTLLMTLDLSKVIDITKSAFKDIENKIIDCPLDCDLSFKSSPNRILRAFYYKAKFGFGFSESVDKSITKNIDLLSSIHPRYAGEILNSILREDSNMIHELIERGVLHKIPLTKAVVKVLLENRRILDVI